MNVSHDCDVSRAPRRFCVRSRKYLISCGNVFRGWLQQRLRDSMEVWTTVRKLNGRRLIGILLFAWRDNLIVTDHHFHLPIRKWNVIKCVISILSINTSHITRVRQHWPNGNAICSACLANLTAAFVRCSSRKRAVYDVVVCGRQADYLATKGSKVLRRFNLHFHYHTNAALKSERTPPIISVMRKFRPQQTHSQSSVVFARQAKLKNLFVLTFVGGNGIRRRT